MNFEIPTDKQALEAFKEHVKITDHILVCDQCAEKWNEIVEHYKSGEIATYIQPEDPGFQTLNKPKN